MKLIALIGVLLVAPAFAQETDAPTLGAGELQLLSKVQQLGQDAQKAINALPEVIRYNAYHEAVNAAIETIHPGYVLDWTKGTLKPKAGK